MTDDELKANPRIRWHSSDDESSWAQGAASAIADQLRDALCDNTDALRLLVSGGSTPGPVYQQLAAVDLDWSRVVVELVDDRDVPSDQSGSNARAIREHLMRDRAATASFVPLRETGRTLADAVCLANQRWRDAATNPVVIAVLGMGDDGHTASLFPGAVNLESALHSTDAYVAINATGCAVAGDYPQRISLTPSGLAHAVNRVLLIRGKQKRETLMAALSDGPVKAMPIRVAWQRPLAPISVYWCAEE